MNDGEIVLSIVDASVHFKIGNNIFKKQNRYEVLNNINLDIYKGESLGIIGRNGAGKSTLLKLISGVIEPDEGKVINKNVTVSLLALQAGFDNNLTGRENSIMSGMLQGCSRKFVEDNLNEIYEYSELQTFFDEPVGCYSTGMRARLAFSISIILNPDILLIDEILSVGDKAFRKKAESTMTSKINSDQTIVLVSHSKEQINRLCNRAIFISDGTIALEGNPIEVNRSYETYC